MDYFETNFNDDSRDQHAELPEDFGWEDMKEGIYDKMPAPKNTVISRWWPLLLLLLIGGCGTGTWFVSSYMEEDKQQANQKLEEDHLLLDSGTEKNTIAAPSEKNNQDSNHALDQTSLSQTALKKELSTIVKNDDDNLKSSYSNQLKTQTVEPKEQTWNPSTTNNLLTAAVTEHKSNSTIKTPSTKWALSESIATLPIKLLEVENNFDDPMVFDFYVPDDGDGQDTKQSKKEIVFGLSSGVVNWIAFDENNSNHDYTSGYPGFTISPSLSLNFNEKHAIQIDYEYSQFEELFDYQGTQEIEVFEQNAKLVETRSSLTGNLIEEHHEDALLSGTRYYNEVKYNDFNIHTFSLGYRNDQIKWSKSSLSFYTGASYLFSINQKGKRLNEEQELIEFDNTNPIFRSKQLGLKLALQYNYKLNDKVDIFSQLKGTKYLTNWEVPTSNASSRPLIYALNIGLNYRLLK